LSTASIIDHFNQSNVFTCPPITSRPSPTLYSGNSIDTTHSIAARNFSIEHLLRSSESPLTNGHLTTKALPVVKRVEETNHNAMVCSQPSSSVSLINDCLFQDRLDDLHDEPSFHNGLQTFKSSESPSSGSSIHSTSIHASMPPTIGPLNATTVENDPVLMTTFYPGLEYTWICPSKQMQRKRTVSLEFTITFYLFFFNLILILII
jgi:hypothetical protein